MDLAIRQVTVGLMLAVGACAGAGGGPSAAGVASEASGPPSALYSEAQARRGQNTFRRICTECHYTSEFRGPVFTNAWGTQTARELYREIRRTMPDDRPGSLEPATYADVIAYILELNGYPAGATELPPDEEVLRGYRLTPPPGGP